jgi:hypothetical protein
MMLCDEILLCLRKGIAIGVVAQRVSERAKRGMTCQNSVVVRFAGRAYGLLGEMACCLSALSGGKIECMWKSSVSDARQLYILHSPAGTALICAHLSSHSTTAAARRLLESVRCTTLACTHGNGTTHIPNHEIARKMRASGLLSGEE